MKQPEKLKTRYTGCMMGAAIGDALGKQNEGKSRKEILEKGLVKDYGNTPAGCPGEKLRPGQYTDDTEQMIVLAESLIEQNGLDVNDLARRISEWGKDALNDPVRRSLVGPSSALAIARLNSGINWTDSGSDIPSCGSSMRAAPVGLFYGDLDRVEENAALSSIPTHNSKAALAGAVGVATGVRCALIDMDGPGIVREAASRASKYDAMLGKKIRTSFQKKSQTPDEVFVELGTSFLASETVPCAFYCFMKHIQEPEKAIIEAVNAGGDTDSIACITGALCGALHGSFFPEKWVKGLENRELIEHLAGLIFERSIQ